MLGYRQLERASRRIAHGVLAADASTRPDAEPSGRSAVVAICVRSSFQAAVAVTALESTRAVFGILDPDWPPPLRARMLRAIGATIVIVDSDEQREHLAAAGWTGTTARLEDLAAADAPEAPVTSTDDDVGFLVLFSSGTTGEPKAFLKTRAQYRANLAVSRDRLGALPGVATFAPGPLSYSLTLFALFEALTTGGRIHLAESLDDLWLTSRVADEGAARLVTVPSALHPLADAARRAPGRFDGLDLIVTGGAALTAATRARIAEALPRTELVGYYGAGELGFIGENRRGDGIRLYPQVEAVVRDESGQPLDSAELGTLWVRSASCSDRYLSAPEGTRLRDAEGWASVGDQGRLHGRTFAFAGRGGDIVASGGHKVALAEVEHAFDGMPGIGAVCAIALPDDRLGAVVGLVLEGDAPPKRELREWAAARLPRASVPRRWFSVAQLPRTRGGKIRRAAAAALIERGEGTRL